MCGIFGVISNTPVNKDKLVAISEIMEHRGPDDEGLLLFNLTDFGHQPASGTDTIPEINLPQISRIQNNYNCAFLHRRLSIIDLSPAGHQPLSYHDEKLWIILNGEIYNYIEIKEELVKKGYNFKSTSDTEVVLAAYMEWGEGCVKYFNGMWAFAIWDLDKKSIFLSRDRLGVKPLYYYFKNNTFIFCSEIKGIQNYLDTNLTLNELALYKFALRGEVQVGTDETTMFNEIKQLMPGNNLVFSDHSFQLKHYWELNIVKNNYSFKENVSHFTELFRSSLSYRLRSDVEVGSCLSGGIDSSSIVSFASAKFQKRFHTFSAIWPGEKCDESFFIDKVNEQWHCYPYSFTPDLDNILDLVEKEVWHQEMPLAGPSVLAQWAVMEEAKRNGIKVLLDGQGGDETLAGYPIYLSTYIREMIFRLKWLQLIKYRKSLNRNTFPFTKLLKTTYHRNLPASEFRIPLSEHYKNKIDFQEFRTDTKFLHLNDFLISHIRHTNLPTLLHLEDRNSMAHSVEARVPFLDYRMVEFSVNIPAEQKIHGGLTKVILREAMKEYLPTVVYQRKDKIGFETPIEKNLFAKNGKHHKQIWELINSSQLSKMDIFDFEKIKNSEDKWINFSVLTSVLFINKFIG